MFEVTIMGPNYKVTRAKTIESARKRALAYVKKGYSVSVAEIAPITLNSPADIY